MIKRAVTGTLRAVELSHMVQTINGAPVMRRGPELVEGPACLVHDLPIDYFDLKLIAMTEKCWYDIKKDQNGEIYGLYQYNTEGPVTFQGFTVAVIKSLMQQKEKWVQFHE